MLDARHAFHASLAFALVVLASASADAATIVSRQRTGRLVDLQIASTALQTTVGTQLLLPRDWDANPSATWPVLYLLHGARLVPSDPLPNYQGWTAHTDVATFTAEANVLIVMPEGGNDGWYSDWYNGGVGGPPAWETFHTTELRTLLESEYRAGTSRAIAGVSMGGFGALSYAARHPGMFRAAASYSGDLDTFGNLLLAGLPSFVNGDDQSRIWGDPLFGFFRWQAHDPVALAFALTTIPVFVSAGNGLPGPLDAPSAPVDLIEGGVSTASQTFVRALQPISSSLQVDFYGNGTHTWGYWERELHRSFRMLMAPLIP